MFRNTGERLYPDCGRHGHTLQDEYELMAVTSRDQQLTISGYKACKMDFDTKDLREKYIFTNVDGTICIFPFTNPTPFSSEVEAMYRSVIISP